MESLINKVKRPLEVVSVSEDSLQMKIHFTVGFDCNINNINFARNWINWLTSASLSKIKFLLQLWGSSTEGFQSGHHK